MEFSLKGAEVPLLDRQSSGTFSERGSDGSARRSFGQRESDGDASTGNTTDKAVNVLMLLTDVGNPCVCAGNPCECDSEDPLCECVCAACVLPLHAHHTAKTRTHLARAAALRDARPRVCVCGSDETARGVLWAKCKRHCRAGCPFSTHACQLVHDPFKAHSYFTGDARTKAKVEATVRREWLVLKGVLREDGAGAGDCDCRFCKAATWRKSGTRGDWGCREPGDDGTVCLATHRAQEPARRVSGREVQQQQGVEGGGPGQAAGGTLAKWACSCDENKPTPPVRGGSSAPPPKPFSLVHGQERTKRPPQDIASAGWFCDTCRLHFCKFCYAVKEGKEDPRHAEKGKCPGGGEPESKGSFKCPSCSARLCMTAAPWLRAKYEFDFHSLRFRPWHGPKDWLRAQQERAREMECRADNAEGNQQDEATVSWFGAGDAEANRGRDTETTAHLASVDMLPVKEQRQALWERERCAEHPLTKTEWTRLIQKVLLERLKANGFAVHLQRFMCENDGEQDGGSDLMASTRRLFGTAPGNRSNLDRANSVRGSGRSSSSSSQAVEKGAHLKLIGVTLSVPTLKLEVEAERVGYVLPLRGEVDPGFHFWTPDHSHCQHSYGREAILQLDKHSREDFRAFEQRRADDKKELEQKMECEHIPAGAHPLLTVVAGQKRCLVKKAVKKAAALVNRLPRRYSSATDLGSKHIAARIRDGLKRKRGGICRRCLRAVSCIKFWSCDDGRQKEQVTSAEVLHNLADYFKYACESYWKQTKGDEDSGTRHLVREQAAQERMVEQEVLRFNANQERKLFPDRGEAETILQQLALELQMPSEAEIFPGENVGAWSRRINVLRRIAANPSRDYWRKDPRASSGDGRFTCPVRWGLLPTLVQNEFPPHVPFIADASFRHLFRTFPSAANTPAGAESNEACLETPFRVEDRLFLIHSLLDRLVHVEVVRQDNIVDSVFAMHMDPRMDTSTNQLEDRKATAEMLVSNDKGIRLSISGESHLKGDACVPSQHAGLKRRWIWFWTVGENDPRDHKQCILLPGGPTSGFNVPKDAANMHGTDRGETAYSQKLPSRKTLKGFALRLLAQPLDDIRKYFGAQVALYFCWLGFYAQSLFIPALLGLAAYVELLLRGKSQDEELRHGWELPTFTFFVMIWSIYCTKGWRREERKIAVKWGTAGHEVQQEDRVDFRPGDSEKPMAMNYVTGQLETSFPDSWYAQGERLDNPAERGGTRTFDPWTGAFCGLFVGAAIGPLFSLVRGVDIGAAEAIGVFVGILLGSLIGGTRMSVNVGEGFLQTHEPTDRRNSRGGRIILGRRLRQLISMLIVLFCVFGLVVEVLFVMWARSETMLAFSNKHHWHSTIGGGFSFLLAALVSLQYNVFLRISRSLNWWENYRKVVDYERNLVTKVFLFQIANSYIALVITAFFRNDDPNLDMSSGQPYCPPSSSSKSDIADAYDYAMTCTCTCTGEVQELMWSIFITRIVVLNCVELGLPMIRNKMRREGGFRAMCSTMCCGSGRSSSSQRTTRSASARARTKATKDATETCCECKCEPGKGDDHALHCSEGKLEDIKRQRAAEEFDVFTDYAEIVVQYGYVVMFVGFFPLAPLFALIECIVEIRVDAYKLCALSRRPTPRLQEHIGTWYTFMIAMSCLGIVTNVALFVIRGGYGRDVGSSGADENPSYTQHVFAVVACIVLLSFKALMHAYFANSTQWVEDEHDRSQAFRRRHFEPDSFQMNTAAAADAKQLCLLLPDRAVEQQVQRCAAYRRKASGRQVAGTHAPAFSKCKSDLDSIILQGQDESETGDPKLPANIKDVIRRARNARLQMQNLAAERAQSDIASVQPKLAEQVQLAKAALEERKRATAEAEKKLDEAEKKLESEAGKGLARAATEAPHDPLEEQVRKVLVSVHTLSPADFSRGRKQQLVDYFRLNANDMDDAALKKWRDEESATKRMWSQSANVALAAIALAQHDQDFKRFMQGKRGGSSGDEDETKSADAADVTLDMTGDGVKDVLLLKRFGKKMLDPLRKMQSKRRASLI